MRHLKHVLVCLLTLVLVPLCSYGEEANIHSNVSIGYHAVGTSDSKRRVAEYQTTDSSINLKAQLFGNYDRNYFNLEGSYWSDDDMSFNGWVDFSRILRVTGSYNEFIHRLDKDELFRHYIKKSTTLGNPQFRIPVGGNIDDDPLPDCYKFIDYPAYDDVVAWETHGPKAFRFTDLDVNKDYIIRRELTRVHSELQLPFFPNLIVHGDFSYERKLGHRQVMTLSHCASCHVTAQSKRIDQTTQIWAVGGTLKWGILTLDYTHREKRFYRDHDAVYNFYEMTHHPPAWDPMYGGSAYPPPGGEEGTFGKRVNYQYARLRFAQVPETKKHTDIVKVRLDLPYTTTLTGMYVYSKTKDTDRTVELQKDLELDYTSWMARLSSSPFRHFSFTSGIKYYNIDSDDAYVKDLGPAPNPPDSLLPNPGSHWVSEDYINAAPNIDFSYNRKSIADRDVTEFDVALNYHFNTYLSVRLGYRIKDVDRDHKLQYWENRAILTEAYRNVALTNGDELSNPVPADYHLDEYDYGDPLIQTVDAAIYFYPWANLNGWISFTYEHNDDPFEYPHAKGEKFLALQTALSPNFCFDPSCKCPSNCDPTCNPHQSKCVCVHGASSRQLGDASNYPDFFVPLNRIEEGTNQPSDTYNVKASVNWSPMMNLSISPTFSYTHQENDDTPWESDQYNAGVNLWWALTQKINITLAYNFYHEKTTTDFWYSFFNG